MGTPSLAEERIQAPKSELLADLLVRTGRGDRGAFKLVYDAVAAQLFGVAMSLTRRRDLAEDILQDAFLSIWRRAAQYSAERGAPMAWMAMIVRHRAIDRLRQLKRRPEDTGVETPEASAEQPAATGGDAASYDVHRALSALPETHRTAVTLAFVEGLTHEELALRLNAPLGTVKSWVRRGLLAMKESLGS